LKINHGKANRSGIGKVHEAIVFHEAGITPKIPPPEYSRKFQARGSEDKYGPPYSSCDPGDLPPFPQKIV